MNGYIKLVVGDWSQDGHNQSDEIIVKCNKTKDKLEKAYQKGVKILGFDVMRDYCDEYEDNTLSEQVCEALTTHGYDCANKLDDGNVPSPKGSWPEIYMFICKLGDPTVEYQIIHDLIPEIDINGYGLYY